VAKQFTIGKNERLKSRKQIELLFNKGEKITVTPYRIFYMVTPDITVSKLKTNLNFGVGVSSKNFKTAVARNRIKRMTREAWRLQKNELKEKLLSSGKKMNVFFIFTVKEIVDFTFIKDKVAVALKKLLDKIDENDS